VALSKFEKPSGYQTNFKKTRERTLRKAGIPYFRPDDLRSTHATRLSAGDVVDEWASHLLRQIEAKVFKKLAKLNRNANEQERASGF